MRGGGWDRQPVVRPDEENLVGHARVVLMRKIADPSGLTAALTAALPRGTGQADGIAARSWHSLRARTCWSSRSLTPSTLRRTLQGDQLATATAIQCQGFPAR